MKFTLDQISALALLALCVAYGVLAKDIELLPGTEDAPFTARTMPIILSVTGSILAILLLLFPARKEQAEPLWRKGQWGRIGLLCATMVAYGLTLKPIGFLLATTAFLALGFFILGERRWTRLALIPLPVAGGFQFILHGLLAIYIEDPFLKMVGMVS